MPLLISTPPPRDRLPHLRSNRTRCGPRLPFFFVQTHPTRPLTNRTITRNTLTYTQNTHTHTTLLLPRALHLFFILSARRSFLLLLLLMMTSASAVVLLLAQRLECLALLLTNGLLQRLQAHLIHLPSGLRGSTPCLLLRLARACLPTTAPKEPTKQPSPIT